jgi:HAE1 family hydrophobic/amphiphilic exporter-1
LFEREGPSQIDRINRQRQVTISANLQGVPIGTAIEKTNQIVKSLKLPPEYTSGLQGKAKEFGRTFENYLVFIFIHGLFHLKGYDHGIIMENKEKSIRSLFNI